MKTTRYRFEAAIQAVTEDSKSWLIDEFKSILESDKDFTRKCDYIGFSLASIDSKVASLDEEIKELQELKKKLKLAKNIALTVGAEVFGEYGIDKLEGAGISSITVTKPTSKQKYNLEILDADALIAAGYCKTIVDEDAVLQAYHLENSNLEKVLPYSKLTLENIITVSKLKINKRRSSNSANFVNTTDTQEIA